MEAALRFGVFFVIFAVMASWEWWKPLRQPRLARIRRWPINLGLAALNTVLLRITLGSAAWSAAQTASAYGFGLFNLFRLPEIPTGLLSLLCLDCAIYAQHVAAHRWQWFWQLHQVHHSDLDFDTTTALRFHPFEIVLSMIYKVLVTALLGVPPAAVVVFEIVLNGCALFNHGNVSLPAAWEKPLRQLLVTPALHRIHHSSLRSETDSNYGFCLSCWDRCFGTLCTKASLPAAEITIGLSELRDPHRLSFFRLMLLPFHFKRKF
ncbi:sterol desaturase family protein [Methylomonas rhizoryzae]|uniref:sterol desaturase family protein n=1 Tax=Methylomonas rhizoryzae TaxID=2608981 RepID=UPI001232A923|nr:sterol desaturase family protein [Methylomonas rhizoryzae]